MAAEVGKLIRQKRDGAEREASQQHQAQRRKNATRTAAVKVGKRESRCLVLFYEDGCDQKPGDDEEDVNADETAGYPGRECVECNN